MNNLKPFVSVCITTYNLEDYISQTIEGVLMQETDFPFEIIIGDDASTDKTREILLAYKEKYPEKIQLILHDKNVGVARNDISIVKIAQGKYLAWCDGDDYWITKDKLQKQYDILEQNPDVSLVHTNWLDSYEPDNKNENNTEEEHRVQLKDIEKTAHGRQAIELFVTRSITGCRFSSSMFRKSYYINALEKFPELFFCGHVCNDLAVFIAMSERGKFYHIPEITTGYRIRKESLSNTSGLNEKRFRYGLGYLRLISLILNKYDFSKKVNDDALRGLLGGLLTYAYNNKKKKEALEIKQLIAGTRYKLTFGQKLAYLGSVYPFVNLLIRPVVSLNSTKKR